MIPNWLHLSQFTGNSGTTVINIAADENTDIYEKSFVLNIKNTGDLEKGVIIIQKTDVVDTLMVFPNHISAPYTGDTYTISITAYTDWEVSYPSWISGVTSGSGDDIITITVSASTSDYRRDVIRFSNNENVVLIDVEQSAFEPIFIVEPSAVTITQSGGYLRASVSANSDWTVSYPSWISGVTSGSAGEYNFNIKVEANNITDIRTGIINFNNGYSIKEITVTQDELIPSLSVSPSFLGFPQSGAAHSTVIVSSNTEWTVTYPSWMNVLTGRIDKHSGSGNTIVNIYVNAYNNTGSDLVGTMEFSTKDLSITQTVDVMQSGGSINYEIMPLTFEILSGGNICVCFRNTYGTYQIRYVEYSKDNGSTWTRLMADERLKYFSAETGDIIQFRGNCKDERLMQQSTVVVFGGFGFSEATTAVFNAKGNPKSLYYEEYLNNNYEYSLGETFQYCRGLRDASNIYIPANFPDVWIGRDGDFNIVTAATTPYLNCSSMFRYSGVVNAPALPATTLSERCYLEMFYGCSSLTTAPELPATTLATSCYQGMFRNCTSLNYIKCLATDISATDCTTDWVQGVSSSGTFVKNANMSDWTTGNSGIPNDWSIINE